MGRATNYLSVSQFELLRWVADGCGDGVYEGGSHRVSARALHNRGLLRVAGSGATWSAQITAEGKQRLEEEAKRLDAERERARREEQAREAREREQQQLRDCAKELLCDVIAAGGRLDLGTNADPDDIQRMRVSLENSGHLPDNQRLAQESTRMDPVLGVTVYLEPNFETLTAIRSFDIPRQLRNPHPAVVEFQTKKSLVSKAEIGRAARFLQGLIAAASEVGWKIPSRARSWSRGRAEPVPDLSLQLPSRELVLTVRELDERGRHVQAYVTETDYYTRQTRTIANKNFQASGKLEVTITKIWEDKAILSFCDAPGASIEEQLPTLIHKLEIAEAEADWSRQEETRRSEIRQNRWEEVKKEAFTKLTYERNAEMLRDQLERRQAAATMRTYADEVNARADRLNDPFQDEARKWSAWIRQHADSTDPINGPLRLLCVTSASHNDLEPHMNGWSSYGPYRR
ncbi:hypothetical protein A5696_16255 [Mycobacterium sp. E2699]|uniref:hypothetical protein n=1 Tax=Mycobacterium sp. E2699 TaxID=1834137 RepID=UPI0008020DE0|nr:hypothetical protein [Mycobacterium sp. E2699]OBH00302.1 hypothetical protein A5696_16255 [Mycobacterium sp. E2699]